MGGSCRRCGGRSRSGARFCAACGSPLPATTAAARSRSRKTVTVLFADVLGLAALAEQRDTEVVSRWTADVHAAVREVLEAHGGTVEKNAGDAVMAVFGVPVSREDDAQRAAVAALALVDQVAPLLARISRAGGVGLELHAALNTGEVLADDTGEESVVLGEAVVVAARLMQHARPGEVLLGPDTAAVLGPVVRTGEPRDLVLRGRSTPVLAHPLLAVVPASGRTRRTTLVGRASERTLLAATMDRAVRGRVSHLATLIGEAGLGKSRLVDDLLDVASAQGVFVRRVRCRSYGARVGWSPLPDLLQGLPTDGLPDDARRVLGALQGEGAAPGAAEVAWAMGLLTRWLAEQGPCIVVLEDLHGAEPEVLDVVQQVVRRLDDMPVLVVVTARPTLLDACPGWGSGLRHALSLTLRPMAAEESHRHAELLFAPASAPAAVVDQVVEAAGGNPLFLEQVVSLLVESGRLLREGAHWRLQGEAIALDIPPSVAALLAARLDRLPPAERHVLERGALLGKSFSVLDVCELVDDGLRDDVEGLIAALVRRDLVRGSGPVHAFPSSLVREAAYGGIARAERARLHETVGRRLAQVSGWDELAGGHLEQAVRHRSDIGVDDDVAVREMAAELLTRAGTRALTGDAGAAALLLERATALLDADDPRRLLVVPDLARVRALTGDLGGAERLLRDALARAVASGQHRAGAHARMALMDLLRSTSPEDAVDQIPALVDEVVPLLRAAGDDRGLSLAWQLQASAHQYRVRWAAMEDPLERALLHAHRAGDRRLGELAQSLLVGSLFHGPTHATEVRTRLEAMVEADGVSRSHRASIAARLAGTRAMQGETDLALQGLDEVREVFLSLGRKLSAAATAFMRGPVLLLADDPAGAATALDESCQVLQAMGDRAYVSTLLALLAEARWRCGDTVGAAAAVDECRQTGSDGDVITQLRWRAVQAKLCAAAGDAEQALRLADEAVSLAARTDELASQGDVLADRAEVRGLLGDGDGEQTDLREAAMRYGRKGASRAVRRLSPRLLLADPVLPDLATLRVPDAPTQELEALVSGPGA